MKKDRQFLSTKNAILRMLSLPGRRRNYLSDRIANFCKYYLTVYENCNWNFSENGELEALKRLSPASIQVVFDVGAHEGTWSSLALKYCPAATIHAFEIARPTAEMLRSQFKQERRVVVNALGLGEEAEAINVAYFPTHRDNTLILPARQALPADAIQLSCDVTVGDSYCRERNIEHVDFCKIDVEGHEYFVLRGFDQMLSRQAIDVIQFEHICASNWRRLHCLEDIFDLLSSYNYRIGRMFPHGILAQPYETSLECLSMANYVAVSARRVDLWQRLEYR